MARYLYFLLTFTLLAGFAQAEGPGEDPAAAFQLIVHRDNPTSEIARDVVAAYYLLSDQTWQDGTPVQPAAQMPGSLTQQAFRAAIHRDSAAAVAEIWEKAPVSGLSRLPAFPTDQAVIEWVKQRPAGIGYVSAQALIPPEVKVLTLVGDLDDEEEDEEAPARLSLVLDASGSMRSPIDGEAKIDIARRTLGSFLESWEEEVEFGLTAFGHRSAGCDDIETLIPLGPSDSDTIRSVLAQLEARGSTPLTQAIRHAAKDLKGENKEDVQIVVVSDGEESCGQDPCELAAELAEAGIPITTYVVGFDVLRNAKAQEQLRCLALESGGTFELAWDARSLRKALNAALERALGRQPEVKVVEIDPTENVTEPLALDMNEVFVPAGSLAVVQSTDQQKSDHERVVSENFWVTETEITQGDWQRVMGSRPSYNQNCKDCPVESINWYESLAFANRLSELKGFSPCYRLRECTGHIGSGCANGRQSCDGDFRCAGVASISSCTGYRLPSATTWEYAARAGAETPFWHRGELTAADANCVAGDVASAERTVGVRGYAPNPFGLYEVHGNVWEWTAETKEQHVRGRRSPRERAGLSTGPPRAKGYKILQSEIRGGSFADQPDACRADRSEWKSSYMRSHRVGLRLLRTAVER